MTFTLQAADAYSKHCAAPSTYANLTPGTWKGTFEQVDTAQLTGALDFKYKWHTSGKFNLVINDEGKAVRLSGTLEVEASVEGTAEEEDATASGQVRRTRADLSLDKDDVNKGVTGGFLATGRLPVELTGQIRGKDYSRDIQRGGTDSFTLTFTVGQATCDGADGVFDRSKAGERYERMEKAGMKVQRGPAKWHAEPEDRGRYEQDLAELKQRLARARTPPTGIVRTRDVELQKYSEIANWIEQRPKIVQPCLIDVWTDAVRRRFHEWIETDAPVMQNHKGDFVSYQDKGQRLISAARGAALLGVDQCTAADQKTAFDAVATAGLYQVRRMLDRAAPVANILTVLREVELMGNISPIARDVVVERIINLARQEFNQRERLWRGLLQQRAGNAPPNAAETQAFCNSLLAQQLLEVLRGSAIPNSVRPFASKYPGGCGK